MFYKDYLNCIMTQGFKDFCEQNQSYFLLSDLASVLMLDKKFKNEEFIVFHLEVKNNRAIINLYRDFSKEDLEFNKQNLLYSQKYEYTDLNDGFYKFYICRNEINTYTFMLPSEY